MTLPVLQAFEKDLTRIVFTINQLSRELNAIIDGTGGLLAYSGTAMPAGGITGVGLLFSSTADFGIFFGSGAPTLSAAKGSLYLRSDGSTTTSRAYINTNGTTTWTAIVTVA